ncbi:hypothetical protein Q4Q39_07330 [Flavivirga amylovorans]|uniref:Transglutaminase domain-containing protein n=1 Tax=Flavivirga amylovorans TaxID=870486 RepID=A0ABT8X0H7_9FLAO|nr:hypothetical protein [Flavivirga amylovorans]MDO5987203.1 hypothetical protein [Flavivirga amylovorans]
MNTYADKTQKNKSQSVSNSTSKMQNSSKSSLQFVDNRPEAAAQQKMQEIASEYSAQKMRNSVEQFDNSNIESNTQIIQPKLYIGGSSTPETRETVKADKLNQDPEIMNGIYSMVDSRNKIEFEDWVSAILHIQRNPKNYAKTGEGLAYGRRTITLDDTEGGYFDSKFKEAMAFIRETEDLSGQVARLLIYTKNAIEYSDEERDTTYTKTTPADTPARDTKFTGDLGKILSKKATICREKSAFAQVLLSELGIDSIAMYGQGPTGAHAWLEIPSAKSEDRKFGRVDPTWGKAGASLRQAHNSEFTTKMETAKGKAALTEPSYPKEGSQIVEAIKQAEQILKTQSGDLKAALTEFLRDK